jgi:microcystin-dependent protein
MEGTIGEVRLFGGTFGPRAWALCSGQIMSIAENTALFSLIGTTYGGDGQTTFALPDLRSRVPIHPGTGPGLSTYQLGQVGGSESITLTANAVSNHSHSLTGTAGIQISSVDGHVPIAVNNFPAANGENIYATATDNSQMAAAVVSLTAGPSTGNSQPVPIVQPVLCLNYIICIEGIFPSRN